ncbi:LysR family transcriptional regulator [Zobellella aerophila]|uniref:LysR substrate-binding domain-containing protein n=1 Tax=Zobellella aerophila TaxID=870480 RepID=A0ABP6WA42_9GAMM
MNNLRRIDLNLMLTLHALLSEKHISRAALRLHKSQPAVSHALAHLRRIFDDPLLVRRSGRLEPTTRASELMQPLTDALEQLGALLAAPTFIPGATQRLFRFGMSDYGSRVVLPGLVKAIRHTAPGIDLEITQASRERMLMDLIDGETDLAMGVFPSLPAELMEQTLFSETFVSVADPRTLPAGGSLSLEAWLARPHVLVVMKAGLNNEIDHALAAIGKARHISITLPHWSMAHELLPDTDLVLTIARRTLSEQAIGNRLALFEPPFAIPPFNFQMAWHPRRDKDPAHRWLRDMICARFSNGFGGSG